ncbi:transposase [Streptomyces sp. NPDC001380]|uniref:transposase n=1 Tax=Streptomyces sp. NPDC001380 TaxID=3364566 RepID=UPI0036B735F7
MQHPAPRRSCGCDRHHGDTGGASGVHRLSLQRGLSAAHLARDPGIRKEALRPWVRQAEADAGERGDRLTSAERDELKDLRRQGAGPRRANGVPGAASVVFAPEVGRPRTRPSQGCPLPGG